VSPNLVAVVVLTMAPDKYSQSSHETGTNAAAFWLNTQPINWRHFMYNFDFNAHQQLSGSPKNDVQQAIAKANEKAHMGNFKVCVTTAGDVLVLPEFSVLMRDDIAEIVYDTDHGYSFKTSSN
jgi:hypothetical protein